MMMDYWQIALFGLVCFTLGAAAVISICRSIQRDDQDELAHAWSFRHLTA